MLSTILYQGKLQKSALLMSVNYIRVHCFSSILPNTAGKPVKRIHKFPEFSIVSAADDVEMGFGNMGLATDLASVLEESYEVDGVKKPQGRMELKRYLENRIKKRVKEQFVNGKFQDLMVKVISNPETLRDAYNCIRLNSNVDITLNDDKISYESVVEKLCSGNFDVKANTSSFWGTDFEKRKQVLVLPNLELKILQEAIRVVLEVVYRPHFSKISHGCRSGKGYVSAWRFIKKDMVATDWWFPVFLKKKEDICILDKLISLMEEKIEDPKLFSIIRSMFDSQVLNLEFGGYPKGHGLPQEGVLSPILTNIYLDLLDREFYRLSMKYEAFTLDSQTDKNSKSKLRSWFRKNLKSNDAGEDKLKSKVHCCRVMDEMFFAVSGSENFARRFKADILSYLKESLHLDVNGKTRLSASDSKKAIRVMGILVQKSVEGYESTKAVHKLKEKVELLGLGMQEAWNHGTARIGKKWLGHGLKKVKESEIRHLVDRRSVLNKISHFRKPDMKTGHWYKHLLKVWMQDIKAKDEQSPVTFLSKNISEPSLPEELTNSYYEFQRQVDKFISAEIVSTNALFQTLEPKAKRNLVTCTMAPYDFIGKTLVLYRLIAKDIPSACSFLTTQEDDQIVDWYLGIVRRWFRWFGECENFSAIKLLIDDHIRVSCIQTLASKHQICERLAEKKFDDELSRIPSQEDLDLYTVNETSDVFENDDALMYGIYNSGLCLLSVAKEVSKSKPCSCFVMGCSAPAPTAYILHVMDPKKLPGWITGFMSGIHPSLNMCRFGMCKQHLKDLYLGNISLQSIDFGLQDREKVKKRLYTRAPKGHFKKRKRATKVHFTKRKSATKV